ncbi:FtsX-like permease family protein [Lutimonas saemankumensis]|uniref:ABC transporter permease n=1 Tax=Lutimonas saemankumensis TaxID=483016 RepID=UPI001CD44E83|nr:FtsX-like permease family protein [Lutimonas saemankumensis]MCA0933743.1 FtsX-like permease family protein [Lutimonas saemankumensis]
MVLTKIAWRSIWRSKLRSSVVIFAIASGLLGGLFSSAWMNGMAKQRVENTFVYETGHMQMHHPDYAENKDVKKTITEVNTKIRELLDYPGVRAVTKRVLVTGMSATANKNMGVNIVGVDPLEEKEVFRIYQRIDSLSGNFFDAEKKNSIVISKALADELKARLKSKIVLTFQDYNGEITGAAFKVVGLFKTDNNPWDQTHVFVRNQDLARVLEMPENQAHEIVMVLDDFEQAGAMVTGLQSKFPDDKVEDWAEISPYLSLMSGYMDTMMGLFMVIILGALGFGIVNTMLMVVLERTKELGMLMAIGMTRKRVFMMIMLETIFLAMVGAIVGELISMFVINYYNESGIDLTFVGEGMESVGYAAITYPMLEGYRYIQITILVVVTAVIASIYPAIKALKLHPAEAIRSI